VTAANDNRIVRFPLRGVPGNYSLDTTPGQVILAGIAKARNHDGGRIAFGPDGMLYATVGDAGVPDRAQDPASLNGKILRMSPIGAVPVDNPHPGSYVYSLGHRNPQGSRGTTTTNSGRPSLGRIPGTSSTASNRGPTTAGRWSRGSVTRAGLSTRSPFGQRARRARADCFTREAPSFWPRFVASASGRSTRTTPAARRPLPGLSASTDVFAMSRRPGRHAVFITNNTSGQSDPRPGDDHLWQVSLDVIREG